MKKDDFLGFKIEKELKKEAKRFATLDSRTLSGFVTQAIKEKISRAKELSNG